MSLIITDIRQCNKGLDTPLRHLGINDISVPLQLIQNAHCIILTNGREFKVLKDRSGHSQENRIYPIRTLIFFVYRYQSDMIEIGSVDANEWILELTRFLTSTELANMSKTMERLAFEKA